MTKNATVINDLTEEEIDVFIEMTNKALEDYFKGVCWSKAYRNVTRWCARRGISSEAMYEWLSD